MPAEVQMIGAPWCGGCKKLRPEVEETCRIAGATFTYIVIEDLPEEEQKGIKALPTIKIRQDKDASWGIYTSKTIEEWKSLMVQSALDTTSTDF